MGAGSYLFAAWLLGCSLLACEGQSADLLSNAGFEGTMDHWHCWTFRCGLVAADEARFGTQSIRTFNRTQYWQGPGQEIAAEMGKVYLAQSWVKLLDDMPGMIGQTLEIVVSFEFPDGEHTYLTIAHQPLLTTADGWVLLQGDFQAPGTPFVSTTFYYQGPAPPVNFAADLASVTEMQMSSEWRNGTDHNIDTLRKSDIQVVVNVPDDIDKDEIDIRVIQTKKSFPFGTCVNSWRYVDPSQQTYRDFIHQHFNWAVLENALKWGQLEWNEGQLNYDRALQTIHGLRDNGLKVRGHNMVWSVRQFVQDWLRNQTGDQLRDTVRQHIEWTMNITSGLLEHWDVNNENLHGQWFQNQLDDRDYDLELFRMMYETDPYPKLFLNDYSVVGSGAATSAYLKQGQRFKSANVHMYGMGVQTHFARGVEPNPVLIKQRLDMLAQVGVPLWTTELDVQVEDEDVRADWYEQALRALYGHPAIEGILFWGFWGDIQSGGQNAALVTGPDLTLTAAGRRVLDLLENQWMTDETLSVSGSATTFNLRGFHGDYELRVLYEGQELANLTQTFTLGNTSATVEVNVQV